MSNRVIVKDGYVIGTAQTTNGGNTDADTVEQMLIHRPTAPDGYIYRLRADTLEWELVEFPPAPDPAEQEISAEEAMSIITGGATDEA